MLLGTEQNGSKLWIYIGSFSFQPGEFAKILITLFLAFYLATNREALSASMRHFGPVTLPRLRMLLPLLVMWGISLLVVVFETDLGSALLFFAFFVIMIYVATGRASYVVVSLLLLAAAAASPATFLFGHVQNRVNIWIDPWSAAASGGYQLVQGLYSLADGGLVGVGIGNGLATTIPFVQSDFIFAAIGEEMGLLGASAILILFLLFCVRGLATAARAKSDCSAFAAVGLTCAISIQAFIIVGGVTKLLPLTGVTLPFMSQGGTSLLASFLIVGLLLRAGDEGTGREAELRSATERESSHPDPVLSLTSQIQAQGAQGAHAVPVVHGSHARGHFGLTTAESGVLGRVALGKRLTALITVFSLFFAALVANLTYIQQIDAERIQTLPTNSHTIARSAYVQRGAIITSDGVTLAESTQQADGTLRPLLPPGDARPPRRRLHLHAVRLRRHRVHDERDPHRARGLLQLEKRPLLARGRDAAGLDRPADHQLPDPARRRGRAPGLHGRDRGSRPAQRRRAGERVLAHLHRGPARPGDLLRHQRRARQPGHAQALYAPGSTFKTVTLAAALDSGTAHARGPP